MTKIAVYSSQRHNDNPKSSVPGWTAIPNWVIGLRFGENVEFYDNVVAYKKAEADIKISFDAVSWFTESPTESFESVTNRERNRIQHLAEASTHCFITETELYQPSFLIGQPISAANITWIIPGTCDWQPTISWQYHLQRIVELNNRLTYNVDYTSSKPILFDALMGGARPHRVFVASQINKNNLQDKFISTIYSVDGKGIYESEIKVINNLAKIQRSHESITFQGISTPMCNIVPFDIYNQTAYSVITETGALNGAHMLTEKIAKAFLGYRLFVVFAGAGYLKHLREQGFRTFDGIIDESYDEIREDSLRWTVAFDQVKWLCDRHAQHEILERALPIVQHNYQHVHTNFDRLALEKIQEKINQLIL